MPTIAEQLANTMKPKTTTQTLDTLISGDTFDVLLDKDLDLHIATETETLVLEATGEITLFDVTVDPPSALATLTIPELFTIIYEYECFDKQGIIL